MNLHPATAYLMHLLRSRSTAGHGVHSPFMYRFITEVLGGRTDRAIIREVESLRKEMLADPGMVKVRDLGAGSAVMKGAERKIRQIASAAALPPGDAALLARIAGNLDMISLREKGGGVPADTDFADRRHHGSPEGTQLWRPQESGTVQQPDQERGEEKHLQQSPPEPEPEPEIKSQQSPPESEPEPEKEPLQSPPEPEREPQPPQQLQTARHNESGQRSGTVILELGASLGISTLAIALAAPDRRVISVEGCPELAAIASKNLSNHGARNAEVICMEFSEALSHLTSLGVSVEMAFIDGNHRGSALADYVQTIRNMGEEMIIVADDIRMNRDMNSMWRTLTGDRPFHTGNRSQILRENGTGIPGDQPFHTGNRSRGSRGETTGIHGNNGIMRPEEARPAPVSLETFRLGLLFFLRNLTPGHYRVRC